MPEMRRTEDEGFATIQWGLIQLQCRRDRFGSHREVDATLAKGKKMRRSITYALKVGSSRQVPARLDTVIWNLADDPVRLVRPYAMHPS